ncbi:MAG: polymerase subunit gamma/tau [Actinomycetota bacterium]|jgi:DNA polymerase-3 subunit gamma/tau|nr:polymerase subunit gamma/tau [Actinomycetota bacterium]
MADETYQSLYRRYRPGRFAEVLGQDHVTKALRNAVRDGRVGHGYLFSGPRGTGKTSTARILAKALNCEKLDDDGEPCGVCDSCTAITTQNSFAVIELDAASNNGVDAMRDLVSRASLGTTGLRKVYIIDEVHMLSTAAANTLLKTLEEPPSHVVFVLATTDEHKVLPTIKSRVQHFEFRLMGASTLGELVRTINADAGLGLADDDLDRVVRRGNGSARDALSVLDQAAALGEAEDDVAIAPEVLAALVDADPARALSAVAAGCAAGRDPRRLAEEVLAALRDAFLAGRAPTLVELPEPEFAAVAEAGRALGPAALVRAMELVGGALADMREALDPRVSLEVALVRVTAPEADISAGALLERIERLERAGPTAAPAVSAPAPPASPPPAARPTGGRGALGAYRGGTKTAPAAPATPASGHERVPGDAPVAESNVVVAPAAAEGMPSRDELTKAWGDTILPGLKGRARALFAAGRFVGVEGTKAVFALPDRAHRDHAAANQAEVEEALSAHFGRRVAIDLVAEDRKPTAAAAVVAAPPDDENPHDVSELRDAPPTRAESPADRLKTAFPGSQEVEKA